MTKNRSKSAKPKVKTNIIITLDSDNTKETIYSVSMHYN